jgi:hypothetical protein
MLLIFWAESQIFPVTKNILYISLYHEKFKIIQDYLLIFSEP